MDKISLSAPRTWSNEKGAFLSALRSPWYQLVTNLEDTVLAGTVDYAHSRGLRAMYPPMTTRTVTCPSGLGSDSAPVRVAVCGVDTYLVDSLQFSLEYGMRILPGGSFTIMPSFRHEEPDGTHLGQFLHSEAEIPGGLDELTDYVEGYVRHLTWMILDRHADDVAAAACGLSHMERMLESSDPFLRLTFDDAADLLHNDSRYVQDEGDWRILTREGERRLMDTVGEFVWVTDHDHLSVPFYQAFANSGQTKAANADLLFGMGEVVGSGERHVSGDEVRKALALHDVPERDYDWYIRMKDEFPMRTSGFGMGVERFLMWVLHHDDIRDIPVISRVAEDQQWPDSVHRP